MTNEETQNTLVEFQRVTSHADVTQVAHLAHEIWNEHYVRIIGQDQVNYMVGKFQSVPAIQEQITDEYEYYLIVHGGAAVGYVAVLPEPERSTLHLSKIYVRKRSRGLGLGESAIRFIQEICRERNLHTIWLTVNRQNMRSIRWYENRGFIASGPTVQDIGGGFVMDDFRMEKKVDRS